AAAATRAQHAQQTGLGLSPDAVAQAAWLHDVIEDTETTADDLRRAGYAEPVIEMIELLSKPPGQQTYEERIATIIESGNLGAILIKLSDNEDNNDPDRVRPEGFEHLTARYIASMARLRRAAAALGYTGP
ncbi:phosphohydrolase, partial [Methylobacterium oryzisoli]